MIRSGRGANETMVELYQCLEIAVEKQDIKFSARASRHPTHVVEARGPGFRWTCALSRRDQHEWVISATTDEQSEEITRDVLKALRLSKL